MVHQAKVIVVGFQCGRVLADGKVGVGGNPNLAHWQGIHGALVFIVHVKVVMALGMADCNLLVATGLPIGAGKLDSCNLCDFSANGLGEKARHPEGLAIAGYHTRITIASFVLVSVKDTAAILAIHKDGLILDVIPFEDQAILGIRKSGMGLQIGLPVGDLLGLGEASKEGED